MKFVAEKRELCEDHRSEGVPTEAVEKKKPEKFRLERESNPAPRINKLPVGLIAQLVRALHRYRRGHGFDSRSSLNFFRFLLFNRLG